jgi:hypothetical protein
VTGTEIKLACIKQATFFNVPFDYFQKSFVEYLPRGESNVNFEGILGPCRVSVTLSLLRPSKVLEKGAAEGSD